MIFLLSLPASADEVTLRPALSISVINEACVVSRSAAWPLKLALFPALGAAPIGQKHMLCSFSLSQRNRQFSVGHNSMLFERLMGGKKVQTIFRKFEHLSCSCASKVSVLMLSTMHIMGELLETLKEFNNSCHHAVN